MKRALAIAILAWASATRVLAQTMGIPDVPTLSVIVEPKEAPARGWPVHGQIILTVRIAAKHPFERLDFRMPALDGAEVVVLQPPKTRKVSSYAGAGYILERILAVFPRRPGTFRIPAMRARGMVMDEKKKEIEFDSRTPAVEIPITDVDPRHPGKWWMVSQRVVVTEHWSKPPDQARMGDVLRREVTVAAFGVTADRIRIPDHGRSRNVQIAEVASDASTKLTATGVVGTRTRSWDLKIMATGIVYIAPIAIGYWDPVLGESMKSGVRGYRIEPLPPDGAAIARRLMAEARAAHSGVRLIALAVLGLLALPLLGLGAAFLWAVLPSSADRRLARSCAGAPGPRQLYRAVLDWRDATASGNDDLAAEVRLAGGLLFSAESQATDSAALAATMARRARSLRLRRLRRRLAALVRAIIGPRVHLAEVNRKMNEVPGE